jgi:hypothetical protein
MPQSEQAFNVGPTRRAAFTFARFASRQRRFAAVRHSRHQEESQELVVHCWRKAAKGSGRPHRGHLFVVLPNGPIQRGFTFGVTPPPPCEALSLADRRDHPCSVAQLARVRNGADQSRVDHRRAGAKQERGGERGRVASSRLFPTPGSRGIAISCGGSSVVHAYARRSAYELIVPVGTIRRVAIHAPETRPRALRLRRLPGASRVLGGQRFLPWAPPSLGR